MREFLHKIAYLALWLVDCVVPKVDRAVLCTWPDFDDQGLAIERVLADRGIDHVWLTHGVGGRHDEVPQARFPRRTISRSTWQATWTYLRSNTIFYTHGIYGFATPPPRKTIVNVWHGMPVKSIGTFHGNRAVRFTFTIATSPYYQEILSQAFSVPSASVPVLGLPRNDRLLRSASSPRPTCVPSGRLVAWLPTYRQSVRGEARADGSSEHPLGGLADFDSNVFERELESLDLTCIIKPHPMADRAQYPPSSSRLRVWSDSDLAERGITLYELLGHTDVLVSDASSVWVDFLLLDRPIVYAFGDYQEYQKTRGFTDASGTEFLPGPLVYAQKELVAELQRATRDRNDPFRAKRREASLRLHTHHDALSADRVVDQVQNRRRGRR